MRPYSSSWTPPTSCIPISAPALSPSHRRKCMSRQQRLQLETPLIQYWDKSRWESYKRQQDELKTRLKGLIGLPSQNSSLRISQNSNSSPNHSIKLVQLWWFYFRFEIGLEELDDFGISSLIYMQQKVAHHGYNCVFLELQLGPSNLQLEMHSKNASRCILRMHLDAF